MVNLPMATSETWSDRASGERKERTEWHRVVIFNDSLVKVAEHYLRRAPRSTSRDRSRPANGPTSPARRSIPRRWCCGISAAS